MIQKLNKYQLRNSYVIILQEVIQANQSFHFQTAKKNVSLTKNLFFLLENFQIKMKHVVITFFENPEEEDKSQIKKIKQNSKPLIKSLNLRPSFFK